MQRFIQPQAPAGDIPQRVAHQTGSVVDVGQHLITIDFAVGGEGADDCKQTLARHAPHRRKLAGGGDHHANFIAAIHPQLARQLLAENHVIFARLQIALFDVHQVRCQGIVLRRVDAQHHADRHAARALQHHVAGGDRRHAGDALEFRLALRQLLGIHRTLFGAKNGLWHQPQDVVLQLAFKAVHHRQDCHQRHYAKRNTDS